MNHEHGPLYVFGIIREHDHSHGIITHLICKDFDEEGFYGLKMVDVDDIRQIDDDSDPVMLELCFLDLVDDISYDTVIGTGEIVCKDQLAINKEKQKGINFKKMKNMNIIQGQLSIDDFHLANIEYLPTFPRAFIEAMLDEIDSDEMLDDDMDDPIHDDFNE